VMVGDIDTVEALRAASKHFGRLAPGDVSRRPPTPEPPQLGERRVRIAREGTTAYLRLGFHAPAFADPDFFPMLVLDAVLTGAKGVNLWASFRTPPPQRSARLYQALVNTGLASSVNGGLIPTQHPFLYTVSVTPNEGTPLAMVEEKALEVLDQVRLNGITPQELRKAKNQLRARLVFDDDSITNIAHQLGYFATIDDWRSAGAIPQRIEAVTLQEVAAVAAARLIASNRTVGSFEPIR